MIREHRIADSKYADMMQVVSVANRELLARRGIPMSTRTSKLATAAYLALFVFSLVVGRMAGGALAYIFAFLLTLPWGAIGVSVVDSVSESGLDNLWVGGAILAVGALLNAAIVYYVAGRLHRIFASIGTSLT
ncbi:MAG: hypothetical protein ACRBK7_23460 [Acidimicrobiales bacterium]